MGSIDQFFIGGTSLPAMPEVARLLIASFDDENVDLRTIVKLTARDPALALKVLRLANSARYVRGNGASNLDEAASVIGTEALRNLVLSASIASVLPAHGEVERVTFWRHALAKGGYAQWLARLVGADEQSAYLAGFMLRSGQLLMARTVPGLVREIEASCSVPGVRFARERHMIGCDHAQVTAELARRWHLPQRLVEAFVHAPEPLEAHPFSLLAGVLNIASLLADAGVMQVPVQAALESADPALLQRLRLDVPCLLTTAPEFTTLTAAVDELIA
jgi:HD-like signal output (HDOD) protein